MSKITGVDINNANIVATYKNVKQSLPVNPDLAGFLDSHQSNIMQLAVAYCSELVNSPTLSNTFFGPPNIDFSTLDLLNSSSDRDRVINPVVSKVLGSGFTTPDPTTVHNKLDEMIINTDTSKAALGFCQSAPCTG